MSKGLVSKKSTKKEPAKTMKEKKLLSGIKKTKKVIPEFLISSAAKNF